MWISSIHTLSGAMPCVLLFSFVSQSYETGALLLADEAGVISGLLVGLNVIDCNCAIKDDDLDQPVGGSTASFKTQ